MKNRRNYYRLLQVQPDAPPEVIRASFRALMKEMKQHPDLGGSSDCAALLIEAYDTLMDPARREAYDREIFRRYTKARGGAGQAGGRRPPATQFCPFCRHPLAREARPGGRCLACNSPLPPAQGEKTGRPPRRSISRIKREGSIRIHTEWPSPGSEARMVDLSPSGMRFISRVKVAPGSVVKINSPALAAVARVSNVAGEDSGRGTMWVVGVSFLAVEFSDTKGSFFQASG